MKRIGVGTVVLLAAEFFLQNVLDFVYLILIVLKTPIITSPPTGGDFIIRTLQGANVVKVALYDLLELIYLYANLHIIQLCLLAKGFRDLVDLIALFDEC